MIKGIILDFWDTIAYNKQGFGSYIQKIIEVIGEEFTYNGNAVCTSSSGGCGEGNIWQKTGSVVNYQSSSNKKYFFL